MKKSITIFLLVMLFGAGYSKATGTWTTFKGEYITGISGSNYVGTFSDGMGFLQNMTTQQTTYLNIGGAFGEPTLPQGIDGSTVVGYYYDGAFNANGFIYTGSKLTTFDAPNNGADVSETWLYGLSGSNLVGVISDRFGNTNFTNGFLCNGAYWNGASWSWAKLTYLPIIPSDIDGNNIVGGNKLYNLFTGNLTTLNVPGSITGISGNNLVGYYTDYSSGTEHGFLYSGTSWTTLDYPGASWTCPQGIDGSNIVGYYMDASGNTNGFIYTVPEPCTLLLLGLGAVMLRKKR